MVDLYTFGLLVFTSFFTLINPLGTMPIFMSMTASLSKQRRRQTAKKATLVAFFTIIAFAFSGQILFRFFGISVNSFRIVGGVIFFAMGWDKTPRVIYKPPQEYPEETSPKLLQREVEARRKLTEEVDCEWLTSGLSRREYR